MNTPQNRYAQSAQLFERAQALIPGGVNSPVRAFRSVGGNPVFMSHGEGAYLFDVDGNRYIDYVMSWGPLILGHAPAPVVSTINEVARKGTSFGWATAREVKLAECVVRAVPNIEKVRFVNSGTEATMSAIRLARGFTGKNRIIKFAGCYHGHADAFLSESAGSGLATMGIPGSAGVPPGAAQDTLTVPYNDLGALEACFVAHPDSVAAVIVEPVAANMGLVQPTPEFLPGLRTLCDRYKALLIFDEVITGFRVAEGGAQQRFGVRADLACFGKIIGGGLPVGAYGGRKDIMDHVAPLGRVYQAGTLSGNPLAMAAGVATLETLAEPGFYAALESQAQELQTALEPIFQKHHTIASMARIGSIFGFYFVPYQKTLPRNYEDVKKASTQRFAQCFRMLLDDGIAMAPSAFEVGFVSRAHSKEDFAMTAKAFAKALGAVTAG